MDSLIVVPILLVIIGGYIWKIKERRNRAIDTTKILDDIIDELSIYEKIGNNDPMIFKEK